MIVSNDVEQILASSQILSTTDGLTKAHATHRMPAAALSPLDAPRNGVTTAATTAVTTAVTTAATTTAFAASLSWHAPLRPLDEE